MEDFKECLKDGKKGELEIIEKLRSMFNYEMEYVGDSKFYQDIDIDLLIYNKLPATKVEIKTDNTKYENIFVEDVSCLEKHTKGWLRKTKADYILYYFKQRGIFYVIPLSVLIEITETGKYEKKRAFDKIVTEDRIIIKTSIGYIIPIVDLVKRLDNDNLFYSKYIRM